MRRGIWRTLLCGVLSSLFATPSLASGVCRTQGQQTAMPLAIQDPSVGAPLLVHLALWTQIVVSKGLARDLKSMRNWCERVRFDTSGGTYLLRGDDDAGALARVAIPENRRAPIAYVTPIPDFEKAMAPGHTGPAPIAGYALMTALDEGQTAWRIYDAIPSDEVLARDIADVLADRIRPAMRMRGKQVQIFVPRGGG